MAVKVTQLQLEGKLNNDDTIVVVKDGKTKRARVKDLNVEGIKTINSSYELQELDGSILCDASLGDITIQLPDSFPLVGKQYEFKKIEKGPGAVTIQCLTGQLIDGEDTFRKLKYKNDFLVLRAMVGGWLMMGEKIKTSAPNFIKMHDEITSDDIEIEIPLNKSGINFGGFSKLVIDIDIVEPESYVQLLPLTWNSLLDKYIPGNVSHRIMHTNRIVLDIQSPDDLYLLPVDVQGVVSVIVGGYNP